jgi:hypothetical protein
MALVVLAEQREASTLYHKHSIAVADYPASFTVS